VLINPARNPSIFRRPFPIRSWYPSQHLLRQNLLPRSQFGSRRRLPRASQRQTVAIRRCSVEVPDNRQWSAATRAPGSSGPAGVKPDWAIRIRRAGAITHQSSCNHVSANTIACGNCMARQGSVALGWAWARQVRNPNAGSDCGLQSFSSS
jgi:hypothetical protein